MTDGPDLLILGGSGPIGMAIERAAAKEGVTTVTASRRPPLRLDAEDAASVEDAIEAIAPRALVYLVNAPTTPWDSAIAAVDRVVRSAARHGAERILFASSGAVYGDRSPSPRAERHALEGSSEYARIKISSEEIVRGIGAECGVPVLSLRVFNVFGPGCAGSLINRLAVGPPPQLMMTTEFVRDYVHVDDVARAFLDAVRRPEVTGVLNIGRGVGVHNLELADLVRPGSFLPASGDGVHSYSVADPTKAAQRLGWSAVIDPLATLRTREGL